MNDATMTDGQIRERLACLCVHAAAAPAFLARHEWLLGREIERISPTEMQRRCTVLPRAG